MIRTYDFASGSLIAAEPARPHRPAATGQRDALQVPAPALQPVPVETPATDRAPGVLAALPIAALLDRQR